MLLYGQGYLKKKTTCGTHYKHPTPFALKTILACGGIIEDNGK